MTDLTVPLVIAAALWGAAAGALLPRAAYRFSAPAGEDWREACPEGHPLRGWLGRGRCGKCPQKTYGPSAVLLSVATALISAALATATGTRPEIGVWLLLAPVCVLLTVVDFRVKRLPDPLTLPLAGAALVLLGAVALVPEHAGEWLTALYGCLALAGGYFVLFLINPAGMAFGDVKLALGLGAVLGWYGWPTLMLGTFAGFLLGGLYAGGLVAVRKAGRKTAIAFGPFMIAGAFVGVLIGAYAA
ncbi:A24 family peptidase [Streptomyces sp. NPDC046909]|uniref:prepilin peptidase n=1 Tax=Streptomyces sp. NPDC046909 TaxID=3155617 RepID=UPI003403BB5A